MLFDLDFYEFLAVDFMTSSAQEIACVGDCVTESGARVKYANEGNCNSKSKWILLSAFIFKSCIWSPISKFSHVMW